MTTGAAELPGPTGPLAAENARLRERLRRAHRASRDLRAELATRPPAEPGDGGGELPLTGDEIRHLYDRFKVIEAGRCRFCPDAHTGPCETCGGLHGRKCPRVKSIEYMPQGDRLLIRKVTYWRDWDDAGIVFPDELPPHPDEAQGLPA